VFDEGQVAGPGWLGDFYAALTGDAVFTVPQCQPGSAWLAFVDLAVAVCCGIIQVGCVSGPAAKVGLIADLT